MHRTRRQLLAACVLTSALVVPGPSAMAQEFPSKPIRLIVPWTAAGTVDMVARQLAERMSARLGQPVIVENRPGATGQIGSQAVVQAPADGHTLLLMSATVHSVSPNLARNFPFDPIDDFAVVTQIVSFPYLMVVSAQSPYGSARDVAEAARQKPGTVSYGSFGAASAPFLISELFALSTGTKLLHVPYKGAAQALTDVAGGQITFFIDSIPSALAQVRGGRLKALAVTTPKRSPLLPDVPTMGEMLPGFQAIAWLGIAAPAKTPMDIVNRLHREIRAITAEAAFAEKLQTVGLDAVASESPAEFRSWLQGQKKYWGDFIEKANIPKVD